MHKFSSAGLISILLLLLLTLQGISGLRVAAAATPVAIITSTPNPDGSIIHVVQAGESLITIAAAYQVTVDEIKTLNGLTSDDIFPGDELVIRLAPTPGPTSTATSTATATPEPTSTLRPTRTPTTTPRPVTPTAVPSDANPQPPDKVSNVLLGAMITLGIIGAALMVVGNLLGRKPKSEGS